MLSTRHIGGDWKFLRIGGNVRKDAEALTLARPRFIPGAAVRVGQH